MRRRFPQSSCTSVGMKNRRVVCLSGDRRAAPSIQARVRPWCLNSVCGGSSIFGVGRLTELASEQSRGAHLYLIANDGGGSGGDPPVKKPSKVNLQGQGWLFCGNHWNFDVISNGNVAENRLPGPVSLVGVGKQMFLERKGMGNICAVASQPPSSLKERLCGP
jgi:hypothetical protein